MSTNVTEINHKIFQAKVVIARVREISQLIFMTAQMLVSVHTKTRLNKHTINQILLLRIKYGWKLNFISHNSDFKYVLIGRFFPF